VHSFASPTADAQPGNVAIDQPRDPDSPSIGVAVALADSTFTLDPDTLQTIEALARAAVAAACPVGGEVRVRLIDDRAMTEAHARHLGNPSVTDVITFDLAGGTARDGAPLDVDLLVCLDEANRHAAALGHPFEREVALYVLHGVLHCLGFDDNDDGASARMHAREDEILVAIGLGAVYAPKAPTTPATE
jgi:probable rRNA maturation factor